MPLSLSGRSRKFDRCERVLRLPSAPVERVVGHDLSTACRVHAVREHRPRERAGECFPEVSGPPRRQAFAHVLAGARTLRWHRSDEDQKRESLVPNTDLPAELRLVHVFVAGDPLSYMYSAGAGECASLSVLALFVE